MTSQFRVFIYELYVDTQSCLSSDLFFQMIHGRLLNDSTGANFLGLNKENRAAAQRLKRRELFVWWHLEKARLRAYVFRLVSTAISLFGLSDGCQGHVCTFDVWDRIFAIGTVTEVKPLNVQTGQAFHVAIVFSFVVLCSQTCDLFAWSVNILINL